MRTPRYIFLHADTNDIFTTFDEPTAQDLDGAKVGTKVIMRLADHHFYGYAGRWLPIPDGVLALTDTEDNQGNPFHVPPSYDVPREMSRQAKAIIQSRGKDRPARLEKVRPRSAPAPK